MVSRIARKSDATEQEIFEIYQVLEPAKVSSYLNENSFLKNLILEAVPNIKRYFLTPQLFLQVVTDKEDPADTRLVISIYPTEEPKEAFDKFKELRQAWWFDASELGQDRLEIILRYR